MARDYKIYYKEKDKTYPVMTYVTRVDIDTNRRKHMQKSYLNRSEVLADARAYSTDRFKDKSVLIKQGHTILFEFVNGERIR